ncbi:hypothetical protein [Bergeyella zoohelcum]|uniref:Uncharacterized protein n=1 Tax=Bergeyella zoohelcum TaxID=1015 RepID=A0A376BXU6_9FLAO|nr:hypothetical protein [Bergeyella zoohelcum]SSZ46478.1 Uncharacterised protein [Bergeyella zoohelcum]
MSNFRLNAKKPANNAGLPTAKTELYLLYVEDIISMPEVNEKGILTTSDIIIKDGRRFHILYQTPSSQVHTRTIEGDTDSRGFKKKLTGSYPGDDLEINEFVKQNINQGFVILVKSCNSNVKKIYGSKCNPLYYTGTFTDDNDRKGYELTFEQEFADDTPVLFYTGNVLVDEDALSPTNPEFSSLFVKLDASNITEENREALRERLGIGDVLPNVATIDLGEETGNAYTKEQIGKIMRTKVDIPSNGPSPDVLGFQRRKFLVGYEEELNEVPGQEEPHYNAVRFSLESIGKNLGNSNLKITKGQIRELDVTGAKLRIKGLEDKSADASFNKMKVQNELGEEAVSNGKQIFMNIPSEMNGSEKQNFINNLYSGLKSSGNQNIQIHEIVDVFIVKQNFTQYLRVTGSNLNFTPNSVSVYVVNVNNGQEHPCNFSIIDANLIALDIAESIPLGEYKVKIVTTEAIVIESTMSFEIVQNIGTHEINVNTITWNEVRHAQLSSDPLIYEAGANGGVINCNQYKGFSGNPMTTAGIPIQTFKSNPIPNLTMNDDFVIQGQFVVHNNVGGLPQGAVADLFGISTDGLTLSLNALPTHFVQIISSANNMKSVSSSIGHSFVFNFQYGHECVMTFEMIKKGNQLIIRMFVSVSQANVPTRTYSATKVGSVTPNSEAVRLLANFKNNLRVGTNINERSVRTVTVNRIFKI